MLVNINAFVPLLIILISFHVTLIFSFEPIKIVDLLKCGNTARIMTLFYNKTVCTDLVVMIRLQRRLFEPRSRSEVRHFGAKIIVLIPLVIHDESSLSSLRTVSKIMQTLE